jgi:hypothetical protein
MFNRTKSALTLALLVPAAAASAAQAAPVTVDMRVEAEGSTLFDAPVTTDGHNVATAAAGPTAHKCDGTNGFPPANPSPGPSATAALDDAARLGGFSFDGPFDTGFDDFFIQRIGPDTNTAQKFWGVFRNSVASNVGGCQTRVRQGDEVLWAYAAFGSAPLRLSGPDTGTTGRPVTLRVTNGETDAPEAGAAVSGATTGPDGSASLTFSAAGIYRLKADRANAIRSNTLVLCVDPPEAAPCTSTDKAAPKLDLSLPGERLASERGRSRTMLVSWQADDAAGAGVSHYSVEVRRVASGVPSAKLQPGDWRTLASHTTLPRAHFRGGSGRAYQFRIAAVDRATNRTTVETDPIVVPIDDRDRGLWRFSRGWTRARRESAWGGSVVTARRAGLSARLRFEGRSVALIGRRLAKGGRLRVRLDGKVRVLSLRGRTGPRTVVWQSRRLDDGEHLLRVRSLGGGPVQLDAVAPQP